MKIKNLLIIVFVFAALSITAYSLSKVNKVQVTTDISLENVRDCKIVYWDETEDVYGYVTKERNVYGSCTNFSEENQTWYNYSCVKGTEQYQNYKKTGEKTVQKSREECEDKEMQFTIDKLAKQEKYKLEYGEWGKCSYTTEGETLIVTCDSMYDGNNDGICKPGESCIQFRITKQGIQRFEKNSRYDWVANDNTFFLEKLDVEVLK